GRRDPRARHDRALRARRSRARRGDLSPTPSVDRLGPGSGRDRTCHRNLTQVGRGLADECTMLRSMPRRRSIRAAVVASVALALAAVTSRLSAQDAPPPALDADLVELAATPDAGLVDAWIIFAAQPAAQVSDELRPEYERLVDAARAPALTALS